MWIVFPLAFFSISGSKLPAYILLVLPAVAVLTADRIRRLASNDETSWSVIATGVIAILLAAGGLAYAVRSGTLTLARGFIITAPLLIAGLGAVLFRRETTTALLGGAFGTVLSLIAIVWLGAFQVAQRQSVRDLIAVADQRG